VSAAGSLTSSIEPVRQPAASYHHDIDIRRSFAGSKRPAWSVGRAATGRARAAPYADVLIRIKVVLRHRVHKASMSEDFTPSNEVACPVCGRPMTFQIIRRAFAENLYAFECKPCGLSMTAPESSTTPAIVSGSTPF
jgi:hypothetical protein